MTVKVAIIGAALSGNKGAAAMLESSMQNLQAEFGDDEVSFKLLSMYPKEDQRLNHYKNLEIVSSKPLELGVIINSLALLYKVLPPLRPYLKKKSSAIRAIVDSDILLDQGGITFVDSREKFLLYNVASILPALMVGTPVFKCAQALGPFKGRLNRLVSRLFLPRVKMIIARGSITYGHLKGLGLTNVKQGADYAFSLGLTKSEVLAAKKRYNFHFKSKVVGISPSVVMQKKVDASGGDYEALMVEFSQYLVREGYEVLIVPHSVRSDTEKLHNNDLPLCLRIHQRLSSNKSVHFIDQELSSQELRYWIGECDYFVASRFHAMVSSLSMSVPTIVIGWSHKYKEVLDMFGLSEWSFGHDSASTGYLTKRFEEMVTHETEIRESLAKHLPTVKELSADQTQEIAKIVNSGK